MGANGWPFATADAFPGADADPHEGAQHVKDIYLKVNPEYEGRYVSPPCAILLRIVRGATAEAPRRAASRCRSCGTRRRR